VRALVTGIAGFVGGHLAALLRDSGFEVCGIDRLPVAAEMAGDGVDTKIGDVCDRAFMTRTVREFQPSHVFHLAWTFNSGGKGSPGSTDSDVVAATALLEAVRQVARTSWILLASSSAVYGSPERLPIDEDSALKPTTAYGVSKVLMEQTAAAFHHEHGMNAIVTRTFNLIGPGVPQRLLPGSLAAQVVAAERGGSRTIRVGRLDSSRDYLDVRDAVRAYIALAMRSTVGPRVFNVCAGVARSCRELVDEFIAAARVPVELVHDTTRMQVGDIDCQRGRAARLDQATGWMPAIPFSTSVREMLELERAAARRRGVLAKPTAATN
jgi:nucleoside-diphosphate-sugar epimerase